MRHLPLLLCSVRALVQKPIPDPSALVVAPLAGLQGNWPSERQVAGRQDTGTPARKPTS